MGEMGVEEAIARVMQAWENSPGTSPDEKDKGSDKESGSDKGSSVQQEAKGYLDKGSGQADKDKVSNQGQDQSQGQTSTSGTASTDIVVVEQSESTPTHTASHPTPTTIVAPTPRSALSPNRPLATPLPPPPARTPTRAVALIDVADTPLAHASVVGTRPPFIPSLIYTLAYIL